MTVSNTDRLENQPQPPKEQASGFVDHCRLYIDGVRIPGEIKVDSALGLLHSRLGELQARHESDSSRGFVWLSLNEPSVQQMHDAAQAFGVHPLIIEDAVVARQRPKVEQYDDQLFLVARSVRYLDFDRRQNSVQQSRQVIETGEVQMVVGKNFIITIRHGTTLPDISDRLALRAGQSTLVNQAGPMSVAWAITDWIVDDYIKIAAELSDDVDALEEEVFTPNSRFNVEQIYLLKREILEMRHAIDPLDPALRLILSNDSQLLNKHIRRYFRDVLDHEIIAKDTIRGFDERLTDLISAAVAKVTLQQNEDMRAISAFVGMAAVPTLIAGIYGMNFQHMPELQTQYGYFIVLGIMVLIVAGMWWFFKKWNWL
ncbi:Mg2+/Co2+ transporter [Corynebacterium mustelae]|uniref:Mg2+/Co2+ transporter n=1 Tax=Corynebacterium mustelae TaxID=571915 RepID=A0A0G3GXL1_9CORY|nr:magnesium and cobalt transport protein CorA [Corynebacterium mustelae]AKK05899.1 Mg2+/Co2+ transporter [Corynebacterium mustelae]